MDALLFTRIACVVLWFLVTCALTPSALRYFRGSFDNCDETRVVLFGAALFLFGSYLSRILSDEGAESTLVAINVFAAVLAILALVVAYQGRER